MRDRIAIALILFGILGTLSAEASAQNAGPDRVVLQPRYSSGKKAVSGRILDYTGTRLSIVAGDDVEPTVYPTEDVVRVETPQTQPHREAIQFLKKRDFTQAEQKFLEAEKQEPRIWVRRELLAELIRLSLREGDYIGAARRFKLLIQSDSTTQYYHLIPVVWSEKVLSASQIDQAYPLLADDLSAMRLVGASILIHHKGFGSLAQETLLALTKDRDDRIRVLAETQHWRLRLKARDISAFTFNGWLRDFEKIPEDLRGGPWFLLGQAYEQQLKRSDAALAYLRVPILYAHDHQLASRACLAAAEMVQSLGRNEESLAIYRELLSNYPRTDAAREARSALQITE